MNFRYIIIPVFFLLAAAACRKPEIKLPVNANPGLSDINNISQVYIFLQIKNGDTTADMHDGQLITATHWVVHTDRRLPLKTLVGPWQILYKKRHKKSIHSMPGAKLYLSHVDTLRRQLALTDFTRMEIWSPFYTSRTYVEKYPASFRNRRILHMDLGPVYAMVDTMRFTFPEDKKGMEKYMKKLSENRIPYEVMLNADYRVSYGRFNDFYSFIALADSSLFRIQPYLFLYNPEDL